MLGRSFRLEDAAEMLGETLAALLPTVGEVADAGIVVAADEAFLFRYGLIWRAVAQLIPRPARRALHRQFGEILLNRGGSAKSAAAHLLEATHASDPTALTVLDRGAADSAFVSANRSRPGAAGAGAHICEEFQRVAVVIAKLERCHAPGVIR